MSDNNSSQIHDYLSKVGRHPVLTKEAQLLHCRRIREYLDWPGGKEQAPQHVRRLGERSLRLMVETNIRLVVSIAKRYQNRGLDLADLIQEGSLGLIRGLELFDPTRGYAVTTYSYWWIRQAMTRAIHQYARQIRIPINTHELIGRIQRFTNEHTALHGRAPTFTEIAEATDTTPERVAQVLQTHTTTVCSSLDAVAMDGTSPLVDFLANPPGTNGTEPDEFVLATAAREDVTAALEYLSDTEAHIIRGRFFDGRTLRDISEDLGFTRSRAGQVQRNALNKLRLRLTAGGHAA